MIILLMGVAGAGKTTVGRALAEELGCEFLDADSLHPATNIEKMRAGVALSDSDRWPWLAAVARVMDEFIRTEKCAVLACSALKQKYRDVLLRPELKLVYLKIDREVARSRAARRHHEYMPAALVESQFEDLEEPSDAFVVNASLSVDDVVERIIDSL